jgi:hypothetical protein
MPHSQGPSSNPYSEPNQPKFLVLIPISLRSVLILSYHLRLGFSKDLFSVKILKVFLLSYFLAICPAHLNLLDL